MNYVETRKVLVDIEVLGMYHFTGMSFEFLTSIILVLAIGCGARFPTENIPLEDAMGAHAC
jgi:hypothetical protein